MSDKPVKTFKAFPLQLSQWGTDKPNFSISRAYKDKDGHWKNSNSFSVSDLPLIGALCAKAFSACLIVERPEPAAEEEPPAPTAPEIDDDDIPF